MKRGQLAFFAFQLACLVFFLIVLFSILFMKRNLWFTLKEFESQTLYSVGSRTLLSTPSCLAHEETYRYYDELTKNYKVYHRVYPGVIDFDKYVDINHFNCMMKDFASEKGGATFRYCMLVLDENRSWANFTRITPSDKIEAPFIKCSLSYSEGYFTPKAVYLSQEKGQKYKICPSPTIIFGPAMGYINGSLRPVFVVLEECTLSNKYEGKSFCELNIKVTRR